MFAQAFESDQILNGGTRISDRLLLAIAAADGSASSTVNGSTAVAAIAIK